MDRLPVDSSTIADVAYDPATMTLEVGFRSGSTYQYFDVPEAVYREFLSSESKGRFLHANIKNSYRYTRM